jgi:uncharacterized protein YybS (DUF2232 family)
MAGWSLLTVALLLSIITPINIITLNLLMVPVLIQYVKLETRRFMLYYGLSLAIVYVVTSAVFSGWAGVIFVAISLFFLPPVIQMGNLYKKRAPARAVITIGSITLLTEMLLTILIAYMFGFNIIAKVKQFMLQSIAMVTEQFKIVMVVDADEVVQAAIQRIPLAMIASSLFIVILTHWIVRKLLNRSGEALLGFRPVRDWMLPRSFVWYFVIAMLLQFFVRDTDSILYIVLMNSLPLLSALFAIQAIAFLFHVAHVKKWKRTLPIIGIVVLIMVPLAFFMFSLLGLFDVAFPIRERMASK